VNREKNMNRRQKSATLIFRITGIIMAFLGIIFMLMRGSFAYPVANITNAGAFLFIVFIIFLHLLPGLLMLVFSKFFGVWVAKDLDD
jgi:hypothetical protein